MSVRDVQKVPVEITIKKRNGVKCRRPVLGENEDELGVGVGFAKWLSDPVALPAWEGVLSVQDR